MIIVDLGGGIKAAKMTAEPGWRWSECIKPVVGGDSCQTHHVGTVIGGTIHVVHEDGSEQDISAAGADLIEGMFTAVDPGKNLNPGKILR